MRTRASSPSRIASNVSRARVGAALGLGVAVVDHGPGERVVEAADLRHVVEREAEDVAGDADRERRREVAPELARALRARGPRGAPRPALETGASKRSRTARMRNGSSNGSRWRSCSSPSLVSIMTPSEARTRFGSAQTVKSSRRRAARAERVARSRASRRAQAPTTRARPRAAGREPRPVRAPRGRRTRSPRRAGKRRLRSFSSASDEDDLRHERGRLHCHGRERTRRLAGTGRPGEAGARTRRAPGFRRVRGWRGSGRARRAAWRGTGRRRPGPGRWRSPRPRHRRTPGRRRPAPRRR